jgi:hypothetical protein
MRWRYVAHASVRHKEQLCAAIQRHLATHPLAADTAAGIVASWLPARGFEQAAEHIEAALDELVEARLLRRHRLPDGNVLYAANVER